MSTVGKSQSLRENFIYRNTEIQLVERHSWSSYRQSLLSKSTHMSMALSQTQEQTPPVSSQPKRQKSDYNIWDLTYTFIQLNMYQHIAMITVFIIILIARNFLCAYLLYLWFDTGQGSWQWLGLLVFSRFFYLILVMKISLMRAQSRTEIILKSNWNSKYNPMNDYFQVLNKKMLFKSFIKGFIPAELSFLYLKGSSERKFKIYATINYIYLSIEGILFYPLICGYIWSIVDTQQIDLGTISIGVTFAIELVILVISGMLLGKGIRKRLN